MPAPWQDPELVARGREPMHAVRREPGLLLDGTWRFQLLPRPDAPIGADWRDIAVPGCWTMQDTADLPQYTNVQMPFAGEPPHVPEANPTGVYERDVEIPAEWAGQRVVLHVGAAESVVIVEVNGRRVGVGKDSHLASEFDVSGHLAAGRNTLRLTVVKWSDATFIEDQDQWWHGGLTRSVYLYATPPVYLGDVAVTAELAEDGAAGTTGAPQRRAAGRRGPGRRPAGRPGAGLARGGPPGGPGRGAHGRPGQLRAAPLGDRHGGSRAHPPPRALRRDGHGRGRGRAGVSCSRTSQPARTGSARLAVEVPAVQAWSAEIPRLYGLEVRLLAADGSVVDRAQVRVGFRSVEVRGTDLLVNGRRVLIQGVNRHDFDQHTGRVISPEAMRRDLLAMKRHGVNAVRTSHYPNDPAFLDLTDELGLYVIDEADIESHAFQASLCDDPRYLAQWVSRVSRMVLRDRNHASVIAWSLGNESGLRRQPRGRRRLGAPRTTRPGPCTTRAPSASIGRAGPAPATSSAPCTRPSAPSSSSPRPAAWTGPSSCASTRTPWATATAPWPSTGTPSSRHPACRAASSGSGGTTASCRRCPTAGRAGPTAATSAMSPTTATSAPTA